MSIVIENVIRRQLDTVPQRDLTGFDLRNRKWSEAVLVALILDRADLTGTELVRSRWDRVHGRSLQLNGIDLSGSQFWGCDLSSTTFVDCNFFCAEFNETRLDDAIFQNCRMEGIKFRSCKLNRIRVDSQIHHYLFDDCQISRASFPEAFERASLIVPEGAFIAYKAVEEGVMRLYVPRFAKRSNSLGIKCRSDHAIPIRMPRGLTECTSLFDPDFKYRLREVAESDHWDDDRWIKCGGGIHFFLDYQAALGWHRQWMRRNNYPYQPFPFEAYQDRS